jgi:hypothetical protein
MQWVQCEEDHTVVRISSSMEQALTNHTTFPSRNIEALRVLTTRSQ